MQIIPENNEGMTKVILNLAKLSQKLETVSIAEPLQNRQHAQNP